MLFLAAVDKFTREELLDLVAFAQAATYLTALRQSAETMAVKTKSVLETASKFTSGLFATLQEYAKPIPLLPTYVFGPLSRWSAQAASFLEKTSSSPFQLAEQIDLEKKKLDRLSIAELRQRLLDILADLAGVPSEKRQNPREFSIQAISKAAHFLKIDTTLVPPEDAERLVFEKYLENLITDIRKQLQKGGPQLEEQLEKELRGLLEKMTTGEQEAIKQAMGLDNLTAKALLNIFKSGGAALAILGGLHAAGFGLFLAAMTMLKALALLTGMSFGFGVYMATASFLGFLTGPVGMALAVTLASGTVGIFQYRKHRQAMLVNLMATMHYRLYWDRKDSHSEKVVTGLD